MKNSQLIEIWARVLSKCLPLLNGCRLKYQLAKMLKFFGRKIDIYTCINKIKTKTVFPNFNINFSFAT